MEASGMNAKRDYRGIDLFRIAAAFLVVAIHTSPLATYSETADFILTREIARVAVPFFFMTTGFFVLGQPRAHALLPEKDCPALRRRAAPLSACKRLCRPSGRPHPARAVHPARV